MKPTPFERCMEMLEDGFEVEAAEERFGRDMAKAAAFQLKKEGRAPMTDYQAYLQISGKAGGRLKFMK